MFLLCGHFFVNLFQVLWLGLFRGVLKFYQGDLFYS